MKSKTFTSYYFLFAIGTLFFLLALLFILKDISSTKLFGPGMIVIGILFHPVYVGWVVSSFFMYGISRFQKSEKSIRITNWLLVSLPFILIVLF